jgi:hypothetical protein
MKKQVFDILEKKGKNDFIEFCEIANKVNHEEIIKAIFEILDLEKKNDYFHGLAWFYFVELQGRNMGEDFHFEVSDFARSFQRYLYSWDRLGRKRVPFEEWSDLADEGIKLLKDLINENKLENYKYDPRYRDFMKRFIQRHEDLRLSGEYPDLNELMDD